MSATRSRSWPAWASALGGSVLGCLAIVAIPQRTFFVDQTQVEHATISHERWACPMMDFIGTRPGRCPVCGMQLERVTAGEVTREQRRRIGTRTARVESLPATVVVRASGSAEYDDRFSQVVIPRISGRIVRRHPATFGCCQEVLTDEPIVDLYSPEAFQAQGELAAALKTGDADLIAALSERFTRWNLAHVAQAIRDGKPPTDVVTIRSPATGQAYLDDQAMVNRTLMVGGEITPDAPLIKLVDPQRLTLVFHVPEPRAHFLREGQAVRLSSDDLGELPEIQAVIGRVSNEINPEIRAREVRIHLTDGRRRILPGSLLNARIQAALGPDLLAADPTDRSTWGSFPQVPKRAILSTGVRHIAWRVKQRRDDGSLQFEPVTVALGPRLEDESGNDRYVIRAGLSPGDEIATEGLFLIDSQAQLAGSASLLFPDGAVQAAPAHQH